MTRNHCKTFVVAVAASVAICKLIYT
uniref:Uncharacterized protein n=1 Tax=Rhizophora mucronata TaxID=61149 RepID=A0A2P2N7H1_RHIMU